jgi:hypothetical protein
MATIGAALTSAKNSSRLSYISVAAFNTVFLTYTTTTTNYVTTGTLTANVINPQTGVTVTSGDCPAGRVLRETGRKLFPDANPGVTTCLVSVYDRITGATGFIDPNSIYFAIYNVDKANFLLQDTDEQVALGPPIYTGGTVTATGNITSTAGNVAATVGAVSAGTTVTAGTSVSAGTTVTAGGNITSTGGNISNGTNTSGDITSGRNTTATNNVIIINGGLVLQSLNGSASFAGTTTLSTNGQSPTITTSAAGPTATDYLVFVTNNGPAGSSTGFLRVTRANGSFVINSSDTNDRSVVAWFIVRSS